VKTFIYKRTHKGDPDERGWFGIHKCMGKCRSWDFDAVVGVGGMSAEPGRAGISRKVNWIGIGRRNETLARDGWPLVKFDHFVLFDEDGRQLDEVAPKLAARMYRKHAPRFVLSNRLDRVEQKEVDRLLRMVHGIRTSSGIPRRHARRRSVRCPSKC
jgi:hypothetical protein